MSTLEKRLEHRATLLRNIFDAGIARVRGDSTVQKWLKDNPEVSCDHLIAIGKAASAMARGALQERNFANGLIITKHDHLEADLGNTAHIECVESDHPIPGKASLDAGQRLLGFLEEAPLDASFLVLISGGASSLVEALAPGLELDDLRRLTDNLLSEGLDIAQMNAVRRSISRIKGGRLAHYLNGRNTCALMISDVPGNDPAVIGSGPMTPDPDTAIPDTLSAATLAILEKAQRMPAPVASAFMNLQSHIIATIGDAKLAAADYAYELGYPVTAHPRFLEGDAENTGLALARRLNDSGGGIHIWGGETTVRLPENPGRGGRNQHLALAAAQLLDGHQRVGFLACGTDGTDGPTEDAGGVVDGHTLNNGRELGMDAREYLARANAGAYLNAVGGLVITGPTGTNVMDLVIAIKER